MRIAPDLPPGLDQRGGRRRRSGCRLPVATVRVWRRKKTAARANWPRRRSILSQPDAMPRGTGRCASLLRKEARSRSTQAPIRRSLARVRLRAAFPMDKGSPPSFRLDIGRILKVALRCYPHSRGGFRRDGRSRFGPEADPVLLPGSGDIGGQPHRHLPWVTCQHLAVPDPLDGIAVLFQARAAAATSRRSGRMICQLSSRASFAVARG